MESNAGITIRAHRFFIIREGFDYFVYKCRGCGLITTEPYREAATAPNPCPKTRETDQ
jgi:hypothetical protein